MLTYVALGQSGFKTSANINRAWGDVFTSYWTVQRSFENFFSSYSSSFFYIDGWAVSTTKQLLGKIYVKVPEKFLRHLVSALQQSPFAEYLKGEKARLWVFHKLNKNKKLRRFKVLPMLCLRNTTDPLLDWIIACDEKWNLYDNCKQSGQWYDCDKSHKHFQKPKLYQQRIWVTVWKLIRVLLQKFTAINLLLCMLACKKENQQWWIDVV